MSLTLIASIPDDGDAIVRDGTSIFLLRPPYSLESRVSLTEVQVEDAVSKHGYRGEGVTFGGYAELIRHLETQVEQHREATGIPLPNMLPLIQTLSLAPREVIKRFLLRIEGELIPCRNWDQAEDLLINMLAARNEEDLRQAALAVRGRLKIAKTQSSSWRPVDVRFTIQETPEQTVIIDRIRQTHCILEPVA